MIRYIIVFLIAILFFSSCEKEESVILDLNISPDEISRIELRADHKTLVPNGVSRMGFHAFVYGKRKIMSYGRDGVTKEFYGKEIEEEFLVPNDQLPADYIKVYDQNGKVVENNYYSTTTDVPGTVMQFYAKGGNLESNRLDITIRELPDESYEEIVIPVVFHVLVPPATAAPTYDISVKYLEEQLQRVSDAFNRKITTDPNAGNAKIVFKLATHDPNGLKMQEPGKNIENITAADFTAMGTSSTKTTQYMAYILSKAKRIIWDPNKYMNIWIAKFTTSTSTTGATTSYRMLAPTVIHSDYDLKSIPGLTMKHQDSFTLNDVKDCLEVGFMLNLNALLSPTTVQGRNEFSLATPIAEYFGILQTRCDKYNKLNADGDSDYCPDTYSFDYGYYPSVFKGNNLDGQPENDPTRPMEYFTYFIVLDMYSYKNSLSVDQVKRLRMVLERCPSRWAYKSDWAFTGEN